MRFRSKIIDVGCLNHFSRVISTIAKLAKTCTLRLTLDKLYFILSDKVANGGVSMWCELNQSSLSTSSRFVTHDIPVRVIPRKLWNDFREPSVPNFDVSIYLPVLKTMKSVVERMKNLSSSVVIEANLNGEMELKIETDLVCITTHFRDLGNPPWVSWHDSQNSTQERDPVNMAEARIDIKRLLQLLAGQQVNPTKALCNIVSKRIVHFILLHEDVSLQYFIPALA
ncbi:checkpoint protein HUS1 isoform X3 [Protobothrops mucrosquamatus]|uniref:checkpoint protein HUS1 isoform X3 n=1 Tax=Protobothrops mucrosquamatus TaxID=103944 RepID=UPI0010FAEDE6|nr:checkpoint protein HUS1 isoform X3 [Protobothrops mucrosquamatus]